MLEYIFALCGFVGILVGTVGLIIMRIVWRLPWRLENSILLSLNVIAVILLELRLIYYFP
jgi:hypothetical protein